MVSLLSSIPKFFWQLKTDEEKFSLLLCNTVGSCSCPVNTYLFALLQRPPEELTSSFFYNTKNAMIILCAN